MIGEARDVLRRARSDRRRSGSASTSGLGPLPAWKRDADFLFAQVAFSIDDAARRGGRRSTSTVRCTPA